MTTGIYGGSFNPIHRGHTTLAEWLVDNRHLDELWFLVSPQNPLKPAGELLDDEARLRLARLAVGQQTGLYVSDFEFHLPRPSLMVHTLQALRQAYTNRDFVLVIGADNWQHFNRWQQPDKILRHHHILVYPRPGYPIHPSTLPPPDDTGIPPVRLVNAPLLDISSTAIRQAIATNPAYSGQGLAPQVWQEIKQKRYYLT